MTESNTTPHLYQEYKAQGPNGFNQTWDLIRRALLRKGNMLSEEEQSIMDSLAQNNYHVGFHKDAKKPNKHIPNNNSIRQIRKITPSGHPIIETSVTYQEMIEAATHISQLLDNEVGFAIQTPDGTIFVGDFNPHANKGIIYYRKASESG